MACVSVRANLTQAAGSRQPLVIHFLDHDRVDTINFLELHRDDFPLGSRHVLANEVSADRQFAVPAVHHDGQLDRLRPTEVNQCVHRRTDGAPGEEHVVDENHHFPRDFHRNIGATHNRFVAGRKRRWTR